jgi:urease subunit alpha
MRMSRAQYARLYGPTTGDMFRLGDTALYAEIEHDHAHPGDELTTGAGKTMRDGEGFRTRGTDASGALDMCVQNAVILDPLLGVVKGDIGVRRGRIVGVGKAGNPEIMADVTPGLETGANTTMFHGDNMVVTPGVIEAHAHFLSPQQVWHALAGGCTTMIGMSPGPHFDTSCAGPHTLGRLMQAATSSRSISASSGAGPPTRSR